MGKIFIDIYCGATFMLTHKLFRPLSVKTSLTRKCGIRPKQEAPESRGGIFCIGP